MKKLTVLFLLLSSLYSKEIYKVGFAQDTLANAWREAQVNDVQEEIAKYDFLKLDIKDADGNLARQITDIEYFIHNNYDFIITSPINAKLTESVLKKAMKKNIKVILLSRGIETKDYTAFIRPDNYEIARQAAQYLVKKIDYKGTILLLKGIEGATTTTLRREGFFHIVSKYPEIHVIQRTANYLTSDAIKVTNDLIQRNITFNAVFSQNDAMLIGVRKALEKHRMKNNIVSVGIDYTQVAKQAIIEGKQDASFTYDTSGKEGVQTIIDIVRNKKVKQEQILDSTMVTPKNVYLVKPIF